MDSCSYWILEKTITSNFFETFSDFENDFFKIFQDSIHRLMDNYQMMSARQF